MAIQHIWFLTLLFIVHYIGDFFLQVYTWKKTTNLLQNLITHTITYIFVLVFGIIVLQAIFPSITASHSNILGFVLINTILHFITDFFTKKITRFMREHDELNAYVNVIALDQLIHYVTLIVTYGLFFIK